MANLSGTLILQGSSGTTNDVVDITGSYELELSGMLMDELALYAHVEAGDGEGIDRNAESFAGFNGDADDDSNVRLTEFFFLGQLLDGALTLQAGKMCLAGCGDNGPEAAVGFDANEYANNERSQFLSPALINNATLEFPEDNVPAVLIAVAPTDWLQLSLAAADADADWQDALDDPFAIAELDLAVAGGNYRFYAWYNGVDHEKWTDPEQTEEENYGYGISLDQPLTELLGVFARYGIQREDVAEVQQAASVGLQISGKPWGRSDDALAIGYSAQIPGDDWKDSQEAEGQDIDTEHLVEVYYRLQIGEHFSLSLDGQWVSNPHGLSSADDVWTFGLRCQLSI